MSAPIDGLLHEAMRLHSAGEYAAAVPLLREAERQGDASVDLLLRLGDCLHRTGEYAAAAAVLNRAIAADPTSATAWYMHGVSAQQAGDLDAAGRSFARFVALKPDDAEGHHRLGSLFHLQGASERAIGPLRDAVRLRPDGVDTRDILAGALGQIGDLEGAAGELEWILRQGPENTRGTGVRNRLAHVQSLLGRTEEAILTLGHALLGPAAGGDVNAVLARFFSRVEAAIPAAIRDKPLAVYLFNVPWALGQIVSETYHFQNIARLGPESAVVIGPPRETYRGAMRTALDVATRDLTYVETRDEVLLTLAWFNFGLHVRPGRVYALFNVFGISREYFHSCRARPDRQVSTQYLQLSGEEQENGQEFFRRFGIGPDSRVVVLHARGPGFRHSPDKAYRDVAIDNYAPAVRSLLKRGYRVVRIGDPTMARLPDLGPGLIDLPFAPGHEPIHDPYMISHCEFMITCHSGPCAYARAFNRPVLVVNGIPDHMVVPENTERVSFKDYRRAGQSLGWAQIVREGLLFTRSAAEFRFRGIDVVEMGAEDIRAVVVDGAEEFERPVQAPSRPQAEFIHRIQETAAALGSSQIHRRRLTDWLGLMVDSCRLSTAYAQLRPYFCNRV